jgi:hypothetical protein
MISNNIDDFVDVVHRDGGEYRAEDFSLERAPCSTGQITARTAIFGISSKRTARFYATHWNTPINQSITGLVNKLRDIHRALNPTR